MIKLLLLLAVFGVVRGSKNICGYCDCSDASVAFSQDVTCSSLNMSLLATNGSRLFANLSTDLVAFNSNNISHLDAHMFDGILLMQTLSLHSNKLTELDPVLFAPVRSTLQALDLARNLLNDSKSVSAALDSMVKLQFLDLGANQLDQVPDLRSLSNLSTLNLTSNKISGALTVKFHLPASLTVLSLSYNQITSITWQLFVQMDKLQHLELKGNPLTHLAADSFFPLISLRVLDLSEMNLPSVDSFAFRRHHNATSSISNIIMTSEVSRVDHRAFCAANVSELTIYARLFTQIDSCMLYNLGGEKARTRLNLVEKSPADKIKCSCEMIRSGYFVRLDANMTCLGSSGSLIQLSAFECKGLHKANVSFIKRRCIDTPELYDCGESSSPITDQDIQSVIAQNMMAVARMSSTSSKIDTNSAIMSDKEIKSPMIVSSDSKDKSMKKNLIVNGGGHSTQSSSSAAPVSSASKYFLILASFYYLHVFVE